MAENTISKVLIGFDLSSTDDAILSFLDQNQSILDGTKLYLIHVKEELSSEEQLKSDGGSIGMKREEVEENLLKKVKNLMTLDNIEYDIKVAEGEPKDEIIKWSKEIDADLLILGHKESELHKVRPNKLVEESICSLLLIPNVEGVKLKNIAVAIDFSDLSMSAVKVAHQFASASGAKLQGIHTYQVPSGYHKTGKDHNEFAKVMEENAKEEAQEFIKEAGLEEMPIKYQYEDSQSTEECISGFVKDNHVDLLVLGSKGRTAAASVLIGSTAKEISKSLYNLPLIIVKDKDNKMDTMDAIKEL